MRQKTRKLEREREREREECPQGHHTRTSMTAGTTKTLKELLPSELQGERNTSNKKNRNSPLSKEQSPSSIQTRKTGRKRKFLHNQLVSRGLTKN